MTPSSASDLLKKERSRAKCSFGCPQIDAVFGGGLPTRGVTEIAGAAGDFDYIDTFSYGSNVSLQTRMDRLRKDPVLSTAGVSGS